ncbi:MAG: hypothetical protein NVS3B10_10300 [Polyangiales bacterium]
MTRARRGRAPYTRTFVRLPEQDLAESILHLAAPLFQRLGPTPSIDEARRAIDVAINLWNANVTASNFWGAPRPKPLADLRRAMRGDGQMFRRLAERWRQEFAFDPRLVGAWSYEAAEDGQHRLVCETALPEGVDAETPPPAEKRVAIGGSFLDEVRVRQGASSYLLFPVEHHRGVVGDDGVATVYAKMPSVVQLFADGRLPPIDGLPVDVTIGVEKLGPMVLREVRCAGEFGRNDVAVLVFRPVSGTSTA